MDLSIQSGSCAETLDSAERALSAEALCTFAFLFGVSIAVVIVRCSDNDDDDDDGEGTGADRTCVYTCECCCFLGRVYGVDTTGRVTSSADKGRSAPILGPSVV
eukprot:PhM_4_TR14207/c0_g1_i1/m.5689